MKKVLLMSSPLEHSYFVGGINDSPILGLLTLKNYIQRKQPDIEVAIIDGDRFSMDQIIDIIHKNHYDFVGLQPMHSSYKNSLVLSQEARKAGSVVIMGGHHATQIAGLILQNRHDIVHYVIKGDGEEALYSILTGKDITGIPNLCYWDNRKQAVIVNHTCNVPLDECFITTIDDSTLKQYNNDRGDGFERGNAGSYRIYSHKGCKNRLNSQYCYFCGRADKGIRFKSPEIYIKELKYLVEHHNAEFIWEVGDDFLQDTKWLETLLDFKKSYALKDNYHLKIFARANRITPEIINILKKLNVSEVAIGFESGSDKILKNIGKNLSAHQNIIAAELLYRNGIDTIASFVAGLPGEDNESLRQTYEQAQKVYELANRYLGHIPQEIFINLIEIVPGSPAFKNLCRHMPDPYAKNDIIDSRKAQDDYFRITFNADSDHRIAELRKEFAGWAKKVNSLGQYSFAAGWEKDELN